MHGWSIKHTTIVERKSRSVIRANNTFPEQFPSGKRTTEMRARFRHRKDSLSKTKASSLSVCEFETGSVVSFEQTTKAAYRQHHIGMHERS